MGSFLVCWLPCFCMTAVWNFGQDYIAHILLEYLEVHQWMFALLIVNSILDPLIYMSNLRLKIKSFCRTFMCKIRHPYAVVQTAEVRKEDVPTTHTLITVRSTTHMSGVCNIPSTEPLCNAQNACWLTDQQKLAKLSYYGLRPASLHRNKRKHSTIYESTV